MDARFDKIPAPVRAALARLAEAGHEAYIVGGCVRDILMSRTPNDYDITTSARPEETAAAFADLRVIETGIAHGTVTVIVDGMPLEITTYRVDGGYSDGRHPDSVSFTASLTEDLARRDFTVNAMAYSPDTGIADPYDGRDDLARGMIRCVGDPATRFGEDALRIMRAVRFASATGFEIDGPTADAARALAHTMDKVSRERIYAELTKLLIGGDAGRVIRDYGDILAAVIPELSPMIGYDQRNPHHSYDLLTHTAVTVANTPAEADVRMAALLHDIGKPRCLSVDGDGIGHYMGHADVGAELAEEILTRLRAPSAAKKTVVTLVAHHFDMINPTEKAVRRALAKLTPEIFFKLTALIRADNMALAPEYRGRAAVYDEIDAIARRMIADGECLTVAGLAIGGDDLKAMGVPPSPMMGEILSALLTAVLDGRVPNEREALAEYAKHMTEFSTERTHI